MRVQMDTGLNEAYVVQKNQSSIKESSGISSEVADSKDVKTTYEQSTYTPDKKALQEHNLIKEIEEANKKIEKMDRGLEFSIHEQTKQIMIKVIDRNNNNEVIREIPSEKILDMMASMCENAGLLVDEKI